MPSPLGHALAGLSAGWIVAPPAAGSSRPVAAAVALYATAGMLPDIDLLFGSHSGPTHGLGAAVIAGAAAMIAARVFGPHSRVWFRTAIGVTAAYASHTLLDWLGADTTAPIGIMALWPFSREHYESSLHVFMAISRRYWLPEFWSYNFKALGRELLILLPFASLAFALRRRFPSHHPQLKAEGRGLAD